MRMQKVLLSSLLLSTIFMTNCKKKSTKEASIPSPVDPAIDEKKVKEEAEVAPGSPSKDPAGTTLSNQIPTASAAGLDSLVGNWASCDNGESIPGLVQSWKTSFTYTKEKTGKIVDEYYKDRDCKTRTTKADVDKYIADNMITNAEEIADYTYFSEASTAAFTLKAGVPDAKGHFAIDEVYSATETFYTTYLVKADTLLIAHGCTKATATCTDGNGETLATRAKDMLKSFVFTRVK